eukprot:TRINITY_DN91451_c0_g1_i1.p1 TRINITY_DN91451_c0_g1~~TRINITY_DN91451_c0_g1_i1.p1  ORF type:complete len:194 (+),score=13.81 TRINITY_DN91451_c0_g1_i1:29-583(+)
MAADAPCCSVCGSGGTLKRCSICKEVVYCSIDCQKQDFPRHRREDGCVKRPAQTTPSAPAANRKGDCGQSSLGSTNTERASRRIAHPFVSGPPCLRCRKPSGEADDQVFADIAQRSIFGNPSCRHGPYCGICGDRIRRTTLAFCCGCNALIGSIKEKVSFSAAECPPAVECPPLPGAANFDRLD